MCCGHLPTRPAGERYVSEFIRITHTLLPDRVFLRVVPELLTGGRTFAGVPRARSCWARTRFVWQKCCPPGRLGPDGIDLNFGCPAKVVNRHGGGASLLLDEPELLLKIAAAVRRAVPAHLPVSAKMRLGFNDDTRAVEVSAGN